MLQINATARLHFSLLSDQDAQLLFEVDQDAEVMRYLNGGTLTSMQTIVEVFVPRMLQYRNPALGFMASGRYGAVMTMRIWAGY